MKITLQCPSSLSFSASLCVSLVIHISLQFTAPHLSTSDWLSLCYSCTLTCVPPTCCFFLSLIHTAYTPSLYLVLLLPFLSLSHSLWCPPPPPFALSLYTSWLGTIPLKTAPQSSLLPRGMLGSLFPLSPLSPRLSFFSNLNSHFLHL